MTIDQLVADAAARGLHEVVLVESVGGWQAIAKFHGALGGPWNVGCDADPVEALRIALRPQIEISVSAGSIFD